MGHWVAATGDRPIISYSAKDYAKLLKYFQTCKEVAEYVTGDDGKKIKITSKAELGLNSKGIYTRHLHILVEYFKDQG